MERYDIMFVGQFGTGTIVPFEGIPFAVPGSPVFFASLAAAGQGKRIAAVTRISDSEKDLLTPMKNADIDLYTTPGEIARYRVVFPTANVDERQPFLVKGGDVITIADIPSVDPCLVHLCCMGPSAFQLELMRALKTREFRLSVDIQGFALQAEEKTGIVHLRDVPEKMEILQMVEFLKLDTAEAQVLTGASDLQDQAVILEEWGSRETVITSSKGLLVRSTGRQLFVKFTNKGTRGRMGRGDTVIGSYLAQRLDHHIEDSARFAAALTSIKMEYEGPFTGSIEDVISKMEASTSRQ